MVVGTGLRDLRVSRCWVVKWAVLLDSVVIMVTFTSIELFFRLSIFLSLSVNHI